MNFKQYKCPKCGQVTGVRIIYGEPGPELSAAANRGDVELGGCCVTDSDPNFKCKTCGHKWQFSRSHGCGMETADT